VADYLTADGPCSIGSLRREIEELPPTPTFPIFWDASVPAGDWLNVTLVVSQRDVVHHRDGPEIHTTPQARTAGSRSLRH
jgi:hypothetical protein